MKKRIDHIDIAKGISISLVALFHSKVKFFIPEIIEPMSLFRVPLFFFLSGVFLSAPTKPKKYLVKKLESLLKPYFSILLFIFFIDSLFSNREHLIQEFFGIFYGNGNTIRWIPMWFLPHLFSVHCFSYFLFRYTGFDNYRSYIKWTCLVILLMIGILNIDHFWNLDLSIFSHSTKLIGLPFSIDIIFITSAYFIAGYILKDKIINFSPNFIILSLSASIFFCIVLFTESHTDLNYRVYTNPILASLGAACGIYITLFLSHTIEKCGAVKNIFILLGGASLYILIFHSYIGNKLYYNISEFINNDNSFLLAAFTFILSICLPLLIKLAVDHNSFLALFFLPLKTNKLLKHTPPMR